MDLERQVRVGAKAEPRETAEPGKTVPRGPLLSPHTLQSLGIELLPDAQSQVSV